MSIVDIPTEMLEAVVRHLDPASLVSLYLAHPDVADRIDVMTGVWERACRRFTPAEPLKAVLEQHLDNKLCFNPDQWRLICLKLAKPSLYVSQVLRHKRRLWLLPNYHIIYLKVSRVFTFGDFTIVDAPGPNFTCYALDEAREAFYLNQTHRKSSYKKMIEPYPGVEDFVRNELESKKSERSTDIYLDGCLDMIPDKTFGSEVSSFFRYGNLLLVGTVNGQLRLYTVEPDIPHSTDILTTDVTRLSFATIFPPEFDEWDGAIKPSPSSIKNLKTELLYVVRTRCKPIRSIDVIDRDKMFSVVCSNRKNKVYRIDIPSQWDTESQFRNHD